jgi:hydrogenase-4 component E
MVNAPLINGLSGLLILTSLLVIEVKKPRWSAVLYSVQSLVLVLIFLALAIIMQADQLYLWAASAFITKSVLVPFILYRALSRVEETKASRNIFGPVVTIIMAAVAIAVAFIVVNQVELKTALAFKPALAVSIAHFFFGMLCILTQRNIFKQVLGFCLMENGSHLTLALLAYNAPDLVEIGIATDAVFTVIIMVLLANQIYKRLKILDVSELNSLKG